MKRCPACGRDYNDDSMSFCLDDGSELLFGPSSLGDHTHEPQTAILHETAQPNEAATRAQIHTTERTAVLPSASAEEPKGKSLHKRLLLAPVALAVIILGGFFGYRYVTQAKQIESIAVMPFVNESGNADVEYLSDGMTETLINSLSEIENLSVKARSSVFRYKGQQFEAGKVASELRVQAFLIGRVVQRGEQLALSIELIDPVSENAIWGKRYERSISELVALQNEVTRDVSSKLKKDLSSSDTARVAKNYSANAEAYELYLRGRHQYLSFREIGFRDGITYFERAIAIDPNYALAYSGLADCYFGLSDQFEPPREVLPKMRAAAEKAIELDASLAEARASLGLVKMYQDHDWVGAEREFRRAIELNPTYAGAYFNFARMLSWLGRNDEAIEFGQRAVNLDPFSPANRSNLGLSLLIAGRLEQSLQILREAQADMPSPAGRLYLALALLEAREPQAALEAAMGAAAMNSEPRYVASLGYVYAVTGHRDKASEKIRELQSMMKRRHVSSFYIAAVYSGLGDKDKAFAYLDKAFEEGSDPLPGIRVFPTFANLRGDPRFNSMLKRMKLPELNI